MLVPNIRIETQVASLTKSSPDQDLVLEILPPLEKNPAAVYLASLSASGRRTQKTALDAMARMLTGNKADAFSCNWTRVEYQHSAAIRSQLASQYAVATTYKMLCALLRVLQETWRLGIITAEAYQRSTDVENIIGETLPTGRELNMGELTALMHVCSTDIGSPAGVRDAALIALLYSGGLRRDEAAKLTVEDYDQSGNRFLVRGKRNNQRYVYLAEGASQA